MRHNAIDTINTACRARGGVADSIKHLDVNESHKSIFMTLIWEYKHEWQIVARHTRHNQILNVHFNVSTN